MGHLGPVRADGTCGELTHASALAGLGRYAAGIEIEERAIRLLSDFPADALEAQLRERLASFARECRKARR